MSRFEPVTDQKGGPLDQFLRWLFCVLDSVIITVLMAIILSIASAYLGGKFLFQNSPRFF